MNDVVSCPKRGAVMATEKQDAYLSLLLDLLPLFFLAFSIFFVKGLRGLRTSFLGKSFLARFVNVVISSALGGAFAVGCALLLPLLDKGGDPTVMVGVVVFVSIAGVKIVDALLYKKLGVHFIDASETGSADSMWVKMSEEERENCMKQWQAQHGENKNGEE